MGNTRELPARPRRRRRPRSAGGEEIEDEDDYDWDRTLNTYQGLPWVSQNKRFALELEGLGKRSVAALPPGEVNEARLIDEAKRDASHTSQG